MMQSVYGRIKSASPVDQVHAGGGVSSSEQGRRYRGAEPDVVQEEEDEAG
jgi:hypothetical protein